MKRIAFTAVILVALGCAGKDPKKVEQAQTQYQVAQELLQKGETTQGLSLLLQAAQLDPSNAEVQNLLGLELQRQDRLDQAEAHLRKAVALGPNYSEGLNNLCVLLIQIEKYDDAIASCRKAVENVLYATPERAYQNMGIAYQKKGDEVKAIESFRKGLIHNPQFVLSRKSLALIYIERGKLPEAVKEFEGAASACSAAAKGAWGNECPEIYYQLGLGYLKLKERAKAQAAFRSCAEADQKGDYGKKCR
ncbi:MAG: tetratricopeptide repeat protein [Pseudomonadota bacterium]